MPEASNQRRLPRTRIARDGILVAGRGRPEYRCTISDINSGGAGIRIANTAAIPEAIFLISLQDRRAFATQVIWRRPNRLGLKIMSVIDLGKIGGAHDFLSRIWIERSR